MIKEAPAIDRSVGVNDEARRYRNNARYFSRRGPEDAVILSRCRFPIAVQPLRIGKLGDFVRIEADFPQLLGREWRIVRHLSGGY